MWSFLKQYNNLHCSHCCSSMAGLTSLVTLALCVVLVTGAPIEGSSSRSSKTSDKSSEASGSLGKSTPGGRNARNYGSSWFDYFPSGGIDDQAMARASSADADSPIYYIRLPPNPYMYVPGLGYVSRPDPPQVPQAPPPPPPTPPVRRRSPFIQLPLDFVSNGKPGSTVLSWPSDPLPPVTPRPKPTRPAHTKPSTINKLKGPYFFNGKPSGLFILQQDPYNSLYADVLHNFYP